MEQDEIIRTVTPFRAKGVPIATKMMHKGEKAEGETSWVTETKRKRTQEKDSLEFPSMEATLISLSFLLSLNLYVCESKVNLSKNCRFQQLCH